MTEVRLEYCPAIGEVVESATVRDRWKFSMP